MGVCFRGGTKKKGKQNVKESTGIHERAVLQSTYSYYFIDVIRGSLTTSFEKRLFRRGYFRLCLMQNRTMNRISLIKLPERSSFDVQVTLG